MTASSSDNKAKPGEHVLRSIGFESNPETIERDLTVLWNVYASDTETNISAFQALELIASHWWNDAVEADRPDPNFGLPPSTLVPVPWWVIHLLGHGWRRYRTQKGMRAGEAFLLQESGQGKRRRIDMFEIKLRDMRLALEVAGRLEDASTNADRTSVEEVVNAVADRFSFSPELVWKAWGKNRNLVLAALDRYRSDS